MNPAVIAAAGITVAAIFLFLAEKDSLADGHVLVRTYLIDAVRWGIVVVLSWLLIPVAMADSSPQRVTTILGLAGLMGAVILIPVRWFVRLGGREPTWELRRIKIEVARLANRVRRDPASVSASRIRDAIARIEALKPHNNPELCDLLTAELSDLLAGVERWNEAGRRSIRIDQLCRQIWPDDMPAPDFLPAVATSRWRLYRTFGEMIEIGSSQQTDDALDAFDRLRTSLDAYRTSDTYRFIDAVQQSADRWLAWSVPGTRWIESFDFAALGPDALVEVRLLWGREAALWGAHLDDEDWAALDQDRARRAKTPADVDESAADVSAADVDVSAADDAQVQAGPIQDVRTGLAAHDDVLETNAPAARQVDARFDAESHAWPE